MYVCEQSELAMKSACKLAAWACTIAGEVAIPPRRMNTTAILP
jgi:hypothetical protein